MLINLFNSEMRLTPAISMKTLQKLVALMLCIVLVLSISILPAQAAGSDLNVSAEIEVLMQIYPEGTVCTNSTPEFHVCAHWPGVLMSAQGCWGFAILFVSKLYNLNLTKNLSVTYLEINRTVSGYYPKTPYASARESLQVGDILAQVNPGHAMVVIAMDDSGITIGEGNYGGRVHYGRRLSYAAIDQHLAYALRILPQESAGANCPCSNFKDMPAEGTAEHEAIDWAYTHEPALTAGTSSITFSPDKTVTRAMALTFLWRAVGMPEPTTSVCPFTDVKNDAYYRKAVLWAVENGITSGTSRTTFSPGQTCSRAEILTFLWRAMGSPSYSQDNTFTDVQSGKWYFSTASWAHDALIEVGENGSFHPKTPCTRAATILYIYRALEHKALDSNTP